MKICDYCGGNVGEGDDVSAPDLIGVLHYSRITCAENLKAQKDKLVAALEGLMFLDPHDLNDSRPCETCNTAMVALDVARNYADHPLRCVCRTCRKAVRDRATRNA